MTNVTEVPWASEEQLRDKQSEVMAAKEALAGPVPLIPTAPDNVLMLPRGLFFEGAWKTRVSLKELTGTDEEALAKLRDPSDFFDLVVALGVERIDDLELATRPQAERVGLLQQLLVGERDQVFLGVLKVTFGDERTLGFTCSMCGSKQELIMSLTEDFKPQVVEDLRDSYTMTTSKGDTLEYRLVTGDDQNEALSHKGATQAEQNSVILSRCITQVNGTPMYTLDPLAYVRKLGMRDRQALLSDLVAKQPSVSLEVTTDCSACGNPQTLSLGWSDLFRAR